MKRNEKGIALIALIIVCVFIYAVIVALSSRKDNEKRENNTNNQSLITTNKNREDRSSYEPKCTKIDYSELANEPEKYKNGDFVLTGEVIQIIEKDNENIELKINITPSTVLGKTTYQDTIHATYQYLRDTETRIQEKNIITIYGKSEGLYTNTLTTGEKEIMPKINIYYIDIKK